MDHGLIQGNYIPLRFLKHPSRRGELNANRWHSSPGYPSHSIKRESERVTSCHSCSSATLVHKFLREMPCTARTAHAHSGRNFMFSARSCRPRWSSRRFLPPSDSPLPVILLGHGSASYCCCWTRHHRSHDIHDANGRLRSKLHTCHLQQPCHDLFLIPANLHIDYFTESMII